jgi:tetratricopeptide (TPR) repeat protein
MKRQPAGAPIDFPVSDTHPADRRSGWLPPVFSSDGWFGLFLAGAVILTYLPVFGAGFVWDDDAHVTRHDLRSLHGLWRIWFEPGATQQYYPLLHTAFWAEFHLWGDAPAGYHVLNVLLHAAVAFLIFLILRRLAVPGARLAAVVFALHPVCVESVAWISEQKNTLSGLFYFASALAYLRFDNRRRAAWYALATTLFLLAVATKTVTATLPAAILVILWWKRGRLSWRADWAPLGPWLILGCVAGWVTAHVERIYIGATGTAFDLTFTDRVLIAGRAVLFYLGKVFWPAGLAFIYPHWSVDARNFAQDLCPAVVLGILAVLFILRRRWRAPLAIALLYVGTLFPALGFVNVYPFTYSYVADHFQYLAVAIAVAGAVGGLARLEATWTGQGILRVATIAGAGLAFACAMLTRMECRQYHDAETLWRTTIARNPDCGMARGNLAGLLLRRGRVGEAVDQYRAALEIPQYGSSAEAHYNLGCALIEEPGHAEEAKAQFEEALRIRPAYAQAHANLGLVLEAEPAHLAQAVDEFQKALRLRPDDADTQCSLAGLLQALPGRLDDAIAHYREALRIRPDFFQARYGLGFALARSPGGRDEAIAQYREAVRLKPSSPEAHFDLANILRDMPGLLNESIAQYEEAVRLKPTDAREEASLGNALFSAGRREEAVDHLRRATQIDPGNARMHLNFGVLLLNIPGRSAEGMAEIRETLRLDPGNDLARQIVNRGQALGQRP